MKILKEGMIILIILICAIQVKCQTQPTGAIKGKIIDKATKQAITGATVEIKEIQHGVSTDTSGNFILKDIQAGSYSLIVSFVGYQEKIVNDVTVMRNKTNYVEAEIEESFSYLLKEVTIKNIRFENSPLTPVSTYGFSREEISRNPGAQGDIFRAIGMLPGVSANGAEYSAIAVRGQGTRDNVYMVDDIPVTQVSHLEENGGGFNDPNGGRFSIFAPRVIDNAQFEGGGFAAQYGRKSASFLGLKIKEGNPKDFTIDGQLDLLGFTINYDGPSYAIKNTSLFASARYQNFGPLIDLIDRKDGGLPAYGDYIFKSTSQLGKNNKLSLVAIYSPETFTRDVENVKADTGLNYTLLLDARNDKSIVGLTLRTLTGNRSYWKNILYYTKTKLDYLYGDSYPVIDNDGHLANGNNIPFNEDIQRIKYSESEIGYRSIFTINFNKSNQKLTSGIDLARIELNNYRRLGQPDTLFSFRLNDPRPTPASWYSVIDPQYYNADFNDAALNMSAYIDYSILLFKKLTINPGIRYDYTGFTDQQTISPRLSGSSSLNGSTSINFAGGIYYQDPVYSEIADQPKDKKLKQEQTSQIILGYKKYFTPDLKLTIEGWYKNFDKLIVRPVNGASEQNNNGTGWAHGIDVNLTKRLTKKIHGQLGYSYLQSKRNDHDGLGEYDFAFSQTHQVNLLLGYKPDKHWILATKFRYATGKPTSSYIIHTAVFNDIHYIRYSQELTGKNNERLSEFIVLDVRADYKFQLKRLGLTMFVDIANINNRLNENRFLFNPIHGRTFADGLAIFPTFGLKFGY